MEDFTERQLNHLSFLQIIRIVGLIIIILPLPLTIRLLFLYVLDNIDCNIRIKILYPIPCSSFKYQWNDKLIDILTYIVILCYLFNKFSHPANFVLLGMLLYRVIGIVKFWYNRNSLELVRYPDLFREFSLILALIHDKWLPNKIWLLVISAIIIAIIKTKVEYLHHITFMKELEEKEKILRNN